MAVPTVVLDVLNSLQIASLPPRVNVGDRVDLGLSSPGLKAFDFLTQPPKLFDIELNNISLENIGIDLTDVSLEPVGAPGQERFELTLDANNAPGPAPGTTDLVTTAVSGVPSQITGTVTQVEKFTGSITGPIRTIAGHIKGRITGTIQNLRGTVRAPALLSGPAPRVGVEWYIENENGERLSENTDFVMLDGSGLTDTDRVPSLIFLPVFAELSDNVDLFARRRVFCNVTVTVGAVSEPRLLGPVDILLPKIQLPTVLVMTEELPGVLYPGAVLIAVPSESSLKQHQLTTTLEVVGGVLDRLQTKLEEEVLDPTVRQLVDFTDTIAQINRIIGLIGHPNIRTPEFLNQDGVTDLWWVTREPGFLGFGYKSWEDCISSLIMIGPPRRAARFYVAKNFWERLGAFEIVLGAMGVGFINTLHASNPECKPTGTRGCTFTHRWHPPPASFNDVISSYQFRPLQ